MMNFEQRIYEKELGPTTGQVNTAFDELRGMMMSALLAGRFDEALPQPVAGMMRSKDTAIDRLSTYCCDDEWRVIAGLLARLAEHPDVTLRQPAAELLNKACEYYADAYAYEYASQNMP